MKRSKYRAIPMILDGIRFASKAEARRYADLKFMEKAGEISDLRLQPKFALHAPDMTVIGHYIADFAYFENGAEIIEDVKGVQTPLFNWKKRHFEAEYGVKIRITRKV